MKASKAGGNTTAVAAGLKVDSDRDMLKKAEMATSELKELAV